jgi:hypothetical protein
MDELGHMQLFGFMATVILVTVCKEGRDGSHGQFLAVHGQGILTILRGLIGITMSLGVWFTICLWAYMRLTSATQGDLFVFMRTGTLLQRMASYCLARSVPALFMSIFALMFASDEYGDSNARPGDVVLLICQGLLDGLMLPFGFARLPWETSGATGRATALLGVAFLTFLACGTLSLAV